MRSLIVVEDPRHWPVESDAAEVVSARNYLTDRRFQEIRRAAVFNVCRSYAYQSVGYYVSLLAAARGHRPLPSVDTLQGMGAGGVVRHAADDLDEWIQRDLARLRSNELVLSIYFGRNVARRYDRLSRALFNLFPAPLLRARFTRGERWRLRSIRPIPAAEVPAEHRDFLLERANEYFARPTRSRPAKSFADDLAILWRGDDPFAPSSEAAIRRFIRAAEKLGIGCEIIGPNDAGRIAEFDALWIRETTQVDHFTYRLARRAEIEGLVVIDEPDAIIRSGSKVYQAEVFARHRIATPRTLVVGPGSEDEIEREIGWPCVVKRADSAFSLGVTKVGSREELDGTLRDVFARSSLAVVQAWTPSDFDWRVGVLERKALFAARYHMARGHWQIARYGSGGNVRYGKVEAVRVVEAPPDVVELGERAASLFGDGLFGVDIKVVDDRPLVMEVNDNPNLDAGYEDAAEGPHIYETLARFFRTRLDRPRGGAAAVASDGSTETSP
ncbi:MAG: RimK family protein [Gemmatimonadota bacterium]|nr:RimK family protein [Gemmatimonadota bacterium]